MVSDRVKGKPVLLDKLKPELGGQVVGLVIEDMERARRAREEREARRRAEPVKPADGDRKRR